MMTEKPNTLGEDAPKDLPKHNVIADHKPPKPKKQRQMIVLSSLKN